MVGEDTFLECCAASPGTATGQAAGTPTLFIAFAVFLRGITQALRRGGIEHNEVSLKGHFCIEVPKGSTDVDEVKTKRSSFDKAVVEQQT